MLRRHILIILLASLIAPATAQAYQPPFYPPGPQWAGPNEILASAFERLRAFVESPAIHNGALAAEFLETQMAPLFDFEAMAAWAARPYYQQMSAEQRTQFKQGMKRRFIELIVNGMGPYISPLPRVRFYPARPAGPDRADEQPLGLVEVRVQEVGIDGLLDLLAGRLVARGGARDRGREQAREQDEGRSAAPFHGAPYSSVPRRQGKLAVGRGLRRRRAR